MSKNFIIVFNDKSYMREVDKMGEVDMVKWFNFQSENNESNREIYDEELLNDLEEQFEKIIVNNITPNQSII